jgi:hypothetical protein
VTLGVKLALSLVANLTQAKETLDCMVSLQCDFLDHLVSIPTFNKYFFPLVFDQAEQEEFRGINFKNMYSSYYYSKRVEQEEVKGGDSVVVGELNKDEGKMFIFANTFEMLHMKLLE